MEWPGLEAVPSVKLWVPAGLGLAASAASILYLAWGFSVCTWAYGTVSIKGLNGE